MPAINPEYILMNCIMQEAKEKSDNRDDTLVNDQLNLAQNPNDKHPKFERYTKATATNYQNLKLSSSS